MDETLQRRVSQSMKEYWRKRRAGLIKPPARPAGVKKGEIHVHSVITPEIAEALEAVCRSQRARGIEVGACRNKD